MRVVIQARVGSSRLPGKILAPLAGRPLLEYVVLRLTAAAAALPNGEVVVATTTAAEDEATAAACRRLGVPCFRGHATDVLGRYLAAAADLADDDLVVRATADNPFYCPRRTGLIITHHQTERADYTCVENLSYVVPEVMTAGGLRRMERLAHSAECREHVTPLFRQTGQPFRTSILPAGWQGLRPDRRLTVDTPEDLSRMRWLCDRLASGGPLFPLESVYELCDREPAGG
jgi:spore coat polysaccharide biosynthesis protein SpsF